MERLLRLPRLGALEPPRFVLVLRRVEPHLALAVSVLTTLATEPGVQYGRDHATRTAHVVGGICLLLRAATAGAALLIAWYRQEQLRLGYVLALALALDVGWLATHLAEGVRPDQDTGFYLAQGKSFIHGHYPHSEYPTGAVLLFALGAALGGGGNHVANALLMAPFALATVAAIWALRTRWSAWFAALLGIWPLDLFYWELRFDLAPTALLAAGVALAYRGRWEWSGVAIGVGAAVKWTPALALPVLVVWLLARGRRKTAVAHAAACIGAWLLLTVPFFAWSPSGAAAAYTKQGGRGITGESLWYLPLRAVGAARFGANIAYSGNAAGWANGLALAIQIALVLALVVLAARTPPLRAGCALAALAPVAFLLGNRIFSAQFLVTIIAGWAFAAALVARNRREQFTIGAVASSATFLNALVYPYKLPLASGLPASVALFALAVPLTAWLAMLAARTADPEPA